jgi:alpha-L-fucosidase
MSFGEDLAKQPRMSSPAPSSRQLAWHALELYGFLHFTVNTFTDKEWGYGDENPALFNPADFDADQIVDTARAGGLKGLILTCKHHDGFCLWPSAYTEHSVKNSPWRGGKGDVVGEVSAACARQSLKFGVYLSPWDRNRPDYGFPSYITYYQNQLRELLRNYGPLFEVWFDGANGGDGYYGGAREDRRIDKNHYYAWETTWNIVRELQPGACIFSDVGPDIRWVGNERGIAGDPCWATLTTSGFAPGQANFELLNTGQRDGAGWLPAECDVSIRPGWFYHAAEDEQVKSPTELVDLYYQSVGRGASLLLNLPPDRRGQIHENDAHSLIAFQARLTRIFQNNLAHRAIASSPQGGAADLLLDGSTQTYWSPGDRSTSAELILEFPEPVTFNVVSLREYLPLGQRIDAFAFDAWADGGWVELVAGSSIGSRRLLRTAGARTSKARLRLLAADALPAISDIGLFQDPDTLQGSAPYSS